MSTPIEIPVIETARLILRAHRLEDFPAMQSMWSNAEVVRYIGGTPSTRQQCWSRLLGYQGHWQFLKFGYWAVEEKATGNYIGELGFADFKRDFTPSIEGLPELGWALVPEFHGRGYATEALLAALQWGKSQLQKSRSVCLISPENKPSLRVAEKLGYAQTHSTVFNQAPVLLFSRNF
jgi:RimJ/RimL family protein N-acetyltransferase